MPSERLSADRIAAALAKKGRTLPVEVFARIDSTNNEAKRRLTAGRYEPTLLLAEEQTAGRGRMGRSFYSPAETGLYMTLLLGRSTALQDPALLTIAAAAAVAGAIERLTGERAGIKWVNDVYMAGKKVCGILCEAVTDGESGETGFLAGIGVNVRTEDFPEELRQKAGSLTGAAADRTELAAEITDRLLAIWEAPEQSGFLEFYRARSFVPGRKVRFTRDGAEREATALAIDDSGALLVRYPDGSVEALRSGEVSVSLPDGVI
ncbi:MAG: biotin--[acetyl-CoA-carboxylase] ligase [Oscillospiraceae bacterium]